MHAFLQNRKFAFFAKRTTGMAAGYFTKVKGAGLFEMDFSRSKFGDDRMIGHMAETMKRSANEYGRAIGGPPA